MTKKIYRSYAKINLTLQIQNKRKDNYHNIHSLFLELNYFDKLSFKRAEKYKLTSTGLDVPCDESNLVTKAYKLLSQKYKITNYLSIHLEKNIPLFAGLGGGSSNAATVLKALNEIWNLNLDSNFLEKIGSKIGADVPFFINGGVQEVKGIGDVLKPIDYSMKEDLVFLLVIPKINISTKWAYEKLNKHLDINIKPYKFRSFSNDFDWDLYSNDFENLVISTYPEIGNIKNNLLNSGAFFTSLSGTGSTMFGVYRNKSLALKARPIFNSYQTILAFPKPNTPYGA